MVSNQDCHVIPRIFVQHRTLLTLGSIMLAGFVILQLQGDARPDLPIFLTLSAFLSLAYFFAIWSGSRTVRLHNASSYHQRLDAHFHQEFKSEAIVILVFAVLYRLLFLPGFPFLSDDIFRYLWDGRVFASGVNPYSFAPNAEALSHLRDSSIYPNVNHPHIPTIYAPVLQLLFLVVYKIWPSVSGFKAVFVLFDLATAFVLLRLLQRLRLPARHLLIYAWNPLLIIETAGNGHLDVVGVFWLTLFFYAIMQSRFALSAFWLALATLTKFVPVLLFPFMWLKMRRRLALLAAAILFVTLVAFFLPFRHGGVELTRALFTYADKWRYNDSLFHLVYAAVHAILPDALVENFVRSHGFTPDATTLFTMRQDLALRVAKGLVAIPFLAFLFFEMRRHARTGQLDTQSMMTLWFRVFGALCLMTPTLHPWYLIWLLPSLTVTPRRAWLLLTGLILLSYWNVYQYYGQNVWQENLFVKLLIFVPFYTTLIIDLLRGLRRRRSAGLPGGAVHRNKMS